MNGRVLTKERCQCGQRFERVILDRTIAGWFDSELLCGECGRRPSRYFIRITGLKIYSEPKSRAPFDSFRFAMRTLETIRGQIQSGTFDRTLYEAKELRAYRFENWVEEWLNVHRQMAATDRRSPLTVRSRERIASNHLTPFFGGLDLRDLRQEHIDKFAASLARYKPNTQRATWRR